MTAEPAATFTIPSIHDGTVLDCRVFHPTSLNAPHVGVGTAQWQGQAAILGHPYAPLGGCYDDPVLEETTAKLLEIGYIVGTFNFRGAGGSAGRTSWTAKPEREDYAAVVGFIVYYAHFLGSHEQTHSSQIEHAPPDATTPARSVTNKTPVLILGGYSYGSMVTMQLPPLSELLKPFASPPAGSAEAQIRLRAEHLASQQSTAVEVIRSSRSGHRPRSPNVRIGGEEDDGSPRKSRDTGKVRQSLEAEGRIRNGVNELFHRDRLGDSANKGRSSHISSGGKKPPVLASLHPPSQERLPALETLSIPSPAYLLISPLQGLINRLATMSLLGSASHSRDTDRIAADEKLFKNPTLAIYGDQDGFVSAHKLRSWATRMEAMPDSKFHALEVATGGHFWVEEGVLVKLVDAVAEFATSLLERPPG